MRKIVKYGRIVQSVAMNKAPSQIGLCISYDKHISNLSPSFNTLQLEGINDKTKDVTTYLRLEIPIENIEDVIAELQYFKDNL